jgi:hypothetical protein
MVPSPEGAAHSQEAEQRLLPAHIPKTGYHLAAALLYPCSEGRQSWGRES